MSELGQEQARQSIEEYIAEREAWLADAVEIVTGDHALDPQIAFEERTMDVEGAVRDDTVGMALSPEQEAQLREIAGRFGLGGQQDIPSGAEYQVQEGGKPWKVLAQLENSLGADTKSIILCDSPWGLRLSS